MQSLDTGSFEPATSEIYSAAARRSETQSYDYDLFVIGSGPPASAPPFRPPSSANGWR